MICCGSSGRGLVDGGSLDQNIVRTSFLIGCVLPTSGRALRTAEQPRAAWWAAAQRRRSLAAVMNSRFFALVQKIAFCEPPSASIVYRLGIIEVGPCRTHPGASVCIVAGGCAACVPAFRCVKVASFAWAQECVSVRPECRVECSGAFGRMRGVPRACTEAAGQSGN